MKNTSIIIDWYGPYTLEEAQEKAKTDYDDGLYVAFGKTLYQRTTSMQYIGIAKNLKSRISKNHHKIKKISKELVIWLGKIATPRRPGKKVKVTDSMLDLAEWGHAFFLQLPLNDIENSRKN